MDKTVLDWIAKNYPGSLPEEHKLLFFQALKKEPEKITEWVKSNLFQWCMIACFQTGRIIMNGDITEDSITVVEHFKTYFAKELESIPT